MILPVRREEATISVDGFRILRPMGVRVDYQAGIGEHPGEPAEGSYRVIISKGSLADGTYRPKRSLHAGELPGAQGLRVMLGEWQSPPGLPLEASERDLVLDALERECPGMWIYEVFPDGSCMICRGPAWRCRVEADFTGDSMDARVVYYELGRTLEVPALAERATVRRTDAVMDRTRARWIRPRPGPVSDEDWARIAERIAAYAPSGWSIQG
jgi:hypothetical protein